MNIKYFSRTLLVLTMIGAFSINAMAKDRVIKWKLAMSWPKHLTPLSSPPQKFAKMVNEMSNGRLVIAVHGPEKHKAALGVFDMTKLGQYQMAHSGSYYWKGKDVNTLFLHLCL